MSECRSVGVSGEFGVALWNSCGLIRPSKAMYSDVTCAKGIIVATRPTVCKLDALISRSYVIERWIEHKRNDEVNAINRRPHPYEFAMCFDC